MDRFLDGFSLALIIHKGDFWAQAFHFKLRRIVSSSHPHFRTCFSLQMAITMICLSQKNPSTGKTAKPRQSFPININSNSFFTVSYSISTRSTSAVREKSYKY